MRNINNRIMKTNSRIIAIANKIIAYLFVLLFVYAAASKLLDFENFQVQLGQSPMLSAFATEVSYAVPMVELFICLLLLMKRTETAGLYFCYCLMVMFTAYIYIILNYSSFVPCSCGGILEDLSWNQHLLFNIIFLLLAAAAFLLSSPFSLRRDFSYLAIGLAISTAVVILLFERSENIMHHRNNFTRRFPHFPAVKEAELDLQSDSYYFAGRAAGKVYLGNYTAPLQIKEIDSSLKSVKLHSIRLDRKDLPFTAIQVRIFNSHFYVADGNVPCIYRGRVSDWKASYVMRGDPYFSLFEPVDSSRIAFRTILKATKTNTLGLFDLSDTTNIHFEPALIQKQQDGVFSADGQLLYDDDFKLLAYVYTYRNQFIVADSRLGLIHRGNTIDTTATAKLKVVTIASSGETKLGAPPLTVNSASALYRKILFVSSALPGKHESLAMWKKANVVDMYDIEKRTYLMSFYVYHSNGKKMRAFRIEGSHLYALIGNKIIAYRLRKNVTDNFSLPELQ